MNIFLERAKELESKMQKARHYIHQHAEAGEYLPNTTKYVMGRLKEIGLTPMEICPSGVTAIIEGAKPGKTFLLRADMDALPMPENNDLSFKTETNAAHNCGHDLHATEVLPDIIGRTNYLVTPSDDFAFISKQVPTTYFMMEAHVDGCSVQHHNPGVLFDEAVLPYGAAVLATCAFKWLKKA